MNNMTPLDFVPWVSWILITIVQLMLLKISKGTLKFFRFAMGYLIIQSAYLLTICIFGNSILYRTFYYMITLIECLVLAGVSIEIGSSLVPKFKQIVYRFGPLVIAIPTFIIYAIISSNEVAKETFIVKSIRISELSFISSLSLLLICIAFEDLRSKTKIVARCYAAFLVMLIMCTEAQIRLGINEFIRTIWPITWLIGLSSLYVPLYSCRNSEVISR